MCYAVLVCIYYAYECSVIVWKKIVVYLTKWEKFGGLDYNHIGKSKIAWMSELGVLDKIYTILATAFSMPFNYIRFV